PSTALLSLHDALPICSPQRRRLREQPRVARPLLRREAPRSMRARVPPRQSTPLAAVGALAQPAQPAQSPLSVPRWPRTLPPGGRSEEHTSELQSQLNL